MPACLGSRRYRAQVRVDRLYPVGNRLPNGHLRAFLPGTRARGFVPAVVTDDHRVPVRACLRLDLSGATIFQTVVPVKWPSEGVMIGEAAQTAPNTGSAVDERAPRPRRCDREHEDQPSRTTPADNHSHAHRSRQGRCRSVAAGVTCRRDGDRGLPVNAGDLKAHSEVLDARSLRTDDRCLEAGHLLPRA